MCVHASIEVPDSAWIATSATYWTLYEDLHKDNLYFRTSVKGIGACGDPQANMPSQAGLLLMRIPWLLTFSGRWIVDRRACPGHIGGGCSSRGSRPAITVAFISPDPQLHGLGLTSEFLSIRADRLPPRRVILTVAQDLSYCTPTHLMGCLRWLGIALSLRNRTILNPGALRHVSNFQKLDAGSASSSELSLRNEAASVSP